MNKFKLFAFILVVSTIIFASYSVFFTSTSDETYYTRAVVVDPKSDIEDFIESETDDVQVVNVRILEGLYEGKEIIAKYQLSYNYSGQYNSIKLSQGDEVFIQLLVDENNFLTEAYVVEIARDKYLLYLLLAFAFSLVLVGRSKGIRAIISLFITITAVIKILLPAILKGYDPVLVSVVVCILIICISLLIVSGFNRKTFSAIIGTTGGVVLAGIIAIIIGSLAKITGLGNDEAQMLIEMPQQINFDFSGLLFSGIIIGTMGATMDVSVSIVAAIHEIKINSPRIKSVDLLKAGMNVGKDTMATMANTLILAYTGGSLHLMLLLMANDTPFSQIINWDMISSEILRALSGSMGVVITIPITAFAACIVEERGANKNMNNYRRR
ncbi:YibE/F family protein [Alkalibaculum sp. M08DMB]|uniref:YibE/F family protein n=1 Tax=Alkalibaculum sporogenes TaxID=2655001 RepID=A0A6A7KBX5_9FIRM|nr:YibE/F family protein [Alkalibaculum sporogenes]MPW27040.1 YibE/F family protein [Alkalibaculum sporogenes]